MMSFRVGWRRAAVPVIVAGSLLSGGVSRLFGVCGPFADVAADSFCPAVLEIFYTGITTGTTPTTFDPTVSVTRLQMAAFLSRTVDGVLKRANRRATSKRFWTPQNSTVLGLTTIFDSPQFLEFDGEDVWVAGTSSVARVNSSDGKVLETWTGVSTGQGVISAMGRILVTGFINPGKLYEIDPSLPAGAVTTVATNLGGSPRSIAFDGSLFWTANNSGSVSIVTPGETLPWTVTTVTTGFGGAEGALYDGKNVWVTLRTGSPSLLKLDSAGAILQTVTLASGARIPVFDGTNIWVPGDSGKIFVVRSSTGAILSTLTVPGTGGIAAAFDGERVLVAHNSGSKISLWKAADLTPLGVLDTGAGSNPIGVCFDGLNFWIALGGTDKLARF